MVFIRKPIDVISHGDGKRYTSITQYEKALDKAGQHIMSDREYKDLRERAGDRDSTPRKTTDHNHVHIDFNNGRVITSKRDDI